MKSVGSLPRNCNSDVFSVEVKCNVLAKRANVLLYLFRIFFTWSKVSDALAVSLIITFL